MCSACYSSCLGCSGANSSQCTSCNPTSPSAAYFDDGSCVNRCNTLSFSPSGSYICQGMTLVLCDFVLCGMTSVLCDFVFEDCSCNDLAVDCTDVGVCVGCFNNTNGNHCELCASGYYHISSSLSEGCTGSKLGRFFFFFSTNLF